MSDHRKGDICKGKISVSGKSLMMNKQRSKSGGKDIAKARAPSDNMACFKCGSKVHWSKGCRTPKHLIELYQESIKNQKDKPKTHFLVVPRDEEYMDDMKPL